MMTVVPNIDRPSESSRFLDPSTLQTVFKITKTMVNILAEVHPTVTIACSFLSIIFKVLEKQHDTNQAIRDLYNVMISAYEDFGKDDILKEHARLKGIYDSLFRQTIECALFIEGYAKKSVIERLVKMDISDEAKKFGQAFVDLKNRLSIAFAKEAVIIAKETVIVTLGVQKSVDLILMRDRLQDLKPPQELTPKSKCMQGTRVATINEMVSWIAQCDGKVMWCSGLAGTGKSSLMGTLHDLLTTDFGGRSRLAAFIRYDRLEYLNARKLITSIAYSLGMFDDRIGMAISQVIQSSRTVATMLDPSAQCRLLLREPLEGIPELFDEGPLVVIIDGLDECDPSVDMLAVLAEGFGLNLPFMRLIVSSRPIHPLTTVFKGKEHIYPLHLDTSSKHVDLDIQFYLEREFATIDDDTFQKMCTEQNAVSKLTTRASGVFIWAATVAKFVCGSSGTSRLEAVLATDTPVNATKALTILYRTALNTLVYQIDSGDTDADIGKCVRNVLAAVLMAKRSAMTESILDNLILHGEGSPRSHHIVSMLGSLLSSNAKDSPIRIIHKSLDDFLQDRNRCGDEWFIDVTLYRREIIEKCGGILKSFVKSQFPSMDMNTEAVSVSAIKQAFLGLYRFAAFDDSEHGPLTSISPGYFLSWLADIATDHHVSPFEIVNTLCRQYSSTRMSFKDDTRDDWDTIYNFLRRSADFYRSLQVHHSIQNSDLAGKVTLVPEQYGHVQPDSIPLNDEVNVLIEDISGYKITSTASVPLFITMLYYDMNTLKIYMRSVLRDYPSLYPGKSLSIEDGRRTSLLHILMSPFKVHQVEVTFLKLFFSTKCVDLSSICQPSPFHPTTAFENHEFQPTIVDPECLTASVTLVSRLRGKT
ncbi:hypothetical protein IW261DRAFT_718627 [Armillaria novae-zelandiae]|uniref:Nephrocystin 3-like N-terminal domain-containing protein n=1 Tax=Armillaria novae-zelandiae TaxID=153914 RepID=A0AA39NWE1_9AGAR|nr:hypothetical protein IW261DRAFT_718627 [Armillaria novae-zelandiae]